ncbi:ABC transporter ATP-binding protein [Pseudonocardia sp. RS010]|uniref:ABC transporter ATP-binding protein n=1 Tax=Pseudonocardia sp. RS010 TaxID=3385979 RepID=UPI00399FEC89
MTASALEVIGVKRRFGGIQAVRGVSLAVAPGTILGVIGPNGSGKTTLVNLVTGVHRAQSGTIRVGGVETTRRPAHAVAARGVARTFQNARVFRSLTVRENLLVSVAHRTGREGLRGLAGEVDRWLELVGLGAFAERVAHELSGGQQKLVEFVRAMVHRPTVVLMDEPFAGVHPHVKATLHEQIAAAADTRGTAFLVVSHEIPDLVRLSHRFLCMAGGQVLAEGDPDEVCRLPAVIDAYLGTPLEGVDR